MTNHKEQAEIKNCPFCNGKAVIEKRNKYDLFVVCKTCHISIGPFSVNWTAIKAYNTRPQSKSIDKVIELLESCFIEWNNTKGSFLQQELLWFMKDYFSTHLESRQGGREAKYKADFLWGKDGKIEELLYDFANCRTEEYREEIYKAIVALTKTPETLKDISKQEE